MLILFEILEVLLEENVLRTPSWSRESLVAIMYSCFKDENVALYCLWWKQDENLSQKA
jgi:hypothetical protein